MEHSKFAHLHVHSHYSLLDGASRIDELARQAHRYRMPALALTDHGNMFGAIEFYTRAVEAGIKPIVGYEAYVAPGSRKDKKSYGIKEASFHITLLVKDEDGYKNLMKLATSAYLEGFYYKPRIDKEILSEHRKGLIALSGCLKGEIPSLIMKGDNAKAREIAGQYRDIMEEGDFYLELQDQGLDGQKNVNAALIEIAKDESIAIVATNDCHYIEKKDAAAQDALLCIQTGSSINNPSRMRFQTDNFYFRSAEEMGSLFSSSPEAISNTVRIVEKCNLELNFEENYFPKFDVPEGEDADSYLRKLCLQKLKGRFQNPTEEIFARLEHELSVIRKMRYASYFLIVWDVVRSAKENGFMVGPGRGSSAGSLVAYVLGITEVDPLKYDLIFERFLNSARAGDFDIDFADEERPKIIEYVKSKYGEQNVAQIVTFGTMAARGVIRDVGRVMDIPYGEVDRIAKLIPPELDITLEQALRKEPELKRIAQADARVKSVLQIAKALEGLVRHASTHAAGVVISDTALTEHVPLMKGGEGEILTQYSMSPLEKAGLLKMDFLGLKTLSVIRETLSNIQRTRAEKIDIKNIPLDDRPTYNLLARAKTAGVFQLESSGVRDLLRKLQPEKFEELIAVLGLYRPGPLRSDMVSEFIKRKKAHTEYEFDHPDLKTILSDTHGVILYQEQIMRIASRLAGFSLEQGDVLQKSISKKIPEVMERHRSFFVKGALKKGIKESVANRVFDNVAHFAGYGFNKAHSTAYALIAYQTAYLKSNYLPEFLAALLSSEVGDTDKLVTYINECRDSGVKVLPPDINESEAKFVVAKGEIRFGLLAVKNLGSSAIDSIVNGRLKKGRYRSLSGFCENIDLRLVNKRAIESLIKCGAFDSFGETRAGLMESLDHAMSLGQQRQRDRMRGQASLFDSIAEGAGRTRGRYPGLEEWHEGKLLAFEKDAIGFYISGHPLARYERLIRTYSTVSSAGLEELEDGEEAQLCAIVTSVKTKITKKGSKMAYVEVDDLDGTLEIVFFPDVFEEHKGLLKKDMLLHIDGVVRFHRGIRNIIAKSAIPITEVERRLSRTAHIKLLTTGFNGGELLSLRKILFSFPGECAVFFHLVEPRGREIVLGGNQELKIEPGEQLKKKVEELAGEGNISFNP